MGSRTRVAPGLDQHRRHPIFVTHQQTDSRAERAAQPALQTIRRTGPVHRDGDGSVSDRPGPEVVTHTGPPRRARGLARGPRLRSVGRYHGAAPPEALAGGGWWDRWV